MHSGRPKKLIFDINKYSKFKDKIIYNVIEKNPPNIETINNEDDNDGEAREYQGQSVTPSNNERLCASYITTSPIYMLISD